MSSARILDAQRDGAQAPEQASMDAETAGERADGGGANCCAKCCARGCSGCNGWCETFTGTTRGQVLTSFLIFMGVAAPIGAALGNAGQQGSSDEGCIWTNCNWIVIGMIVTAACGIFAGPYFLWVTVCGDGRAETSMEMTVYQVGLYAPHFIVVFDILLIAFTWSKCGWDVLWSGESPHGSSILLPAVYCLVINSLMIWFRGGWRIMRERLQVTGGYTVTTIATRGDVEVERSTHAVTQYRL